MPEPFKFCLLAICQQAASKNGEIITNDGEKRWVTNTEWGPSSSSNFLCEENKPPANVKLFDSEKEALQFSEGWKGHPWYCVPKSFEVVKLQPHIQQVGWEIANDNSRPI